MKKTATEMTSAVPEPSIWTRPPPRPRRNSLSRQSIVRAAIHVADAGGPAALTMHAVAGALGAYTPMSLYRYVYSKEGLFDLILDAVLEEVEPPARPGVDWRADVYALEMRTWTAIMRHPWYAQLVHSRPPLGPNALRRTEFLLQTFHRLADDLGVAMGYVSLVERLVIGLALQLGEEARAERHVDLGTPEGALEAMAPLRALLFDSADAYPLLSGWARAPSGPSPAAQFELGLEMFLDGIAARHPIPRRRAGQVRTR